MTTENSQIPACAAPTTSVLEFKWGTSRGRDTYGYSICTAYVDGKRIASCNGGGYDMEGTAFADALMKLYPERLLAIAGVHCAGAEYENAAPLGAKDQKPEWKPRKVNSDEPGRFYGLYAYFPSASSNPEKVSMDGGCGFRSIERIANAIGLTLKYISHSASRKLYTLTDSHPVHLPVKS